VFHKSKKAGLLAGGQEPPVPAFS